MIKKTNQEKKQLAHALFVHSSLTQVDIAAQAGCTRATLTKWLKEGSWQKQRDARTIMRNSCLESAYLQLQKLKENIALNGGIPTKADADVKAVLIKEISTHSHLPLHLCIEVIDELTDFVAKHYPKKVKDFTPIFNEFIQSKAQV